MALSKQSMETLPLFSRSKSSEMALSTGKCGTNNLWCREVSLGRVRNRLTGTLQLSILRKICSLTFVGQVCSRSFCLTSFQAFSTGFLVFPCLLELLLQMPHGLQGQAKTRQTRHVCAPTTGGIACPAGWFEKVLGSSLVVGQLRLRRWVAKLLKWLVS